MKCYLLFWCNFLRCGTDKVLSQKFNLGEIYIIKQSNSELRVNIKNRTIAK